jgi:hypothetical protein
LQTPAPYTHALNADPQSSGETPSDTQFLGMKSRGGFVEIVVLGSQILMTLKEAGALRKKQLEHSWAMK